MIYRYEVRGGVMLYLYENNDCPCPIPFSSMLAAHETGDAWVTWMSEQPVNLKLV